MPASTTTAEPCAGADTDSTRRLLPSGSVSFSSTAMVTGVSSAVPASSSSAKGGSFTLVTSTVTCARASAPCGSLARTLSS